MAKYLCIACDSNLANSKEHIFPEWLIRRTNTHKTSINWINSKSINPLSATIPLCKNCNKKLGDGLEAPVSKIFYRLENGGGFNDFEAELLVKWMWKLSNMFSRFGNPKGNITGIKLIDKLLFPIGKPRDRIILAIALFKNNDEGFIDLPMGNDIFNLFSAVLAAGVYSKIAMIVSYTDFANIIPHYYSKYILDKDRGRPNEPRLMIPNVGFADGVSAIKLTKETAEKLFLPHEQLAYAMLSEYKKIKHKA